MTLCDVKVRYSILDTVIWCDGKYSRSIFYAIEYILIDSPFTLFDILLISAFCELSSTYIFIFALNISQCVRFR